MSLYIHFYLILLQLNLFFSTVSLLLLFFSFLFFFTNNSLPLELIGSNSPLQNIFGTENTTVFTMSRSIIRNNLLPPLLPTFYKGQLGRLAVIGGCEDYTGAPYFSAHAAMLAGVDLVHVICEQNASPVIKAYSPDLMVHPYIVDDDSLALLQSRTGDPSDASLIVEKRLRKIKSLISRMDAIVIGPGFGRNDKTMTAFLLDIIKYLVSGTESEGISRNIPVILDADALYHLSVNEKLQDIIKTSLNPNIIMTPNVVEFQRLCQAFSSSADSITDLSSFLNCTIVEKGPVDRICYHGSETILECKLPGSLKRVGGQGDSLTGMIGAFLCWGMGAYKKKLYKTPDDLHDEEIIPLCCLAGCTTTRIAGHLAFGKYGRSMLTSNLHEFINRAFIELGREEELY